MNTEDLIHKCLKENFTKLGRTLYASSTTAESAWQNIKIKNQLNMLSEQWVMVIQRTNMSSIYI